MSKQVISGLKLISNRSLLLTVLTLLLVFCDHSPSRGNEQNGLPVYLGSEACRECHPEEYSSFITYAKKNRSFESIERLRTRLPLEDIKKCYSCHTTGYGQPGGFTSLEETPLLKNAGCEVCHGPGSVHVQTKSTRDIKTHLTRKDCEVCHISARIKAFRYRPLIHGGAH